MQIRPLIVRHCPRVTRTGAIALRFARSDVGHASLNTRAPSGLACRPPSRTIVMRTVFHCGQRSKYLRQRPPFRFNRRLKIPKLGPRSIEPEADYFKFLGIRSEALLDLTCFRSPRSAFIPDGDRSLCFSPVIRSTSHHKATRGRSPARVRDSKASSRAADRGSARARKIVGHHRRKNCRNGRIIGCDANVQQGTSNRIRCPLGLGAGWTSRTYSRRSAVGHHSARQVQSLRLRTVLKG